MLADLSDNSSHIGSLDSGIHINGASRVALLSFISQELPRWRDRTDRETQTSETKLTSQLCAHLNSAARRAPGWDSYQFRVEEPDEIKPGRRIDLVASPCSAVVWIEGRSYTDFDTIMPIECKRLPTPREGDRDEREYVVSGSGSTGGIQRFKEGNHGAAHTIGGMIAYVQEDSHGHWHNKVQVWIEQLAQAGHAGWSADDLLEIESEMPDLQLSVYRSRHCRKSGLPDIELRHLWLNMQ
jgi:hypothetical protein